MVNDMLNLYKIVKHGAEQELAEAFVEALSENIYSIDSEDVMSILTIAQDHPIVQEVLRTLLCTDDYDAALSEIAEQALDQAELNEEEES
jgi:hypothetical protein